MVMNHLNTSPGMILRVKWGVLEVTQKKTTTVDGSEILRQLIW